MNRMNWLGAGCRHRRSSLVSGSGLHGLGTDRQRFRCVGNRHANKRGLSRNSKGKRGRLSTVFGRSGRIAGRPDRDGCEPPLQPWKGGIASLRAEPVHPVLHSVGSGPLEQRPASARPRLRPATSTSMRPVAGRHYDGGATPMHLSSGILPEPAGDRLLIRGLWRSLVARLTGGQEVVGSNPASPTAAGSSTHGRLPRLLMGDAVR